MCLLNINPSYSCFNITDTEKFNKERKFREIAGGIINSQNKQAASLRAARRLLLCFYAAQPIKLPL